MALSLRPFEQPFGAHNLRGDVWRPARVRGTLIVLHGGGTSAAAGFDALRHHLAGQQVASVAFDAVGHGRTGGPQLGTTLRDRVDQVEAVVAGLGLAPEGLALAGFSMGAYVAVHAAERLGLRRLVLAIPAAYAPEAFDQPFGPAFSAVLRRPRSWAASDAFVRIARYPGHLLVLSAEHDAVVPAEIPARYVGEAVQACSRHHHVVPGAGHDLSRHYDQHPEARHPAYAAIAALCLAPWPGLPGLRLREAVPADAAACIELRGRTRQNAVSADRLLGYGITAASWAEGIRNGGLPGCVAEADGRLLGYCFGDRATGEVQVLALLPEAEGRGLGRQLLAEVMTRLRALGHGRLYLGCSPDPASRSHGFYRHLGWRPTGQVDAHGDEVLEHLPEPH